MKLKPVGFYREYVSVPDLPSIRASMTQSPHEDEEQIIHFLQNGRFVLLILAFAFDLFDSDHGVIGTDSLYSDGVWFWPHYLTSLIKRYHVRLPEEFVEHMERSGWSPQVLPEIQWRKIFENDNSDELDELDNYVTTSELFDNIHSQLD